MRIQHNIAALNSYRNLVTNNNAVSKNLEKLSSGYRINRAGDDAAGLAISEKMRAQITGLNTAQKNANDGISLVQTAEGAMTEIHSMLNRMVELASQSANGTYADAVDRENLQKEVASLKDEVNRIADSTNFNGINLLDGSLDSSVTKTVKDATINGLEGMELKDVIDPTVDTTQLHEEGTGAAKTSFEVDLEGLAWQLDEDYNADGTEPEHIFQLRGVADDGTDTGRGDKLVGEIKYKLSGKSGGDTVTAEDLAEAIAKVNDGVLNLTFKKDADSNIEIEYSVKNEGSKLVFEMTDKGFKKAAEVENSTDENEKPGGNAKGLNVFQGNFNFLADFTYAVGATPEADHKYTQTTTPEGYNPMQDSCTSNIKPGNANSGIERAEAMVNFRNIEIKDGSGVQIGDTYYVWAGSDETLNGEYGDKVKTVDIRDLVNENSNKIEVDAYNPDVASTTFTNLTKALSRLSEAAADNEMFNAQVGKYGDVMIFTERVTNTSDADLTTLEGMKKQLQKFSSVTENVSVKEAGGKDLTLQIGDTSDAFNQLTVSVGDMHVEAMGISDVDISTQAGAQTAIDKIKSAINYVSSTRGDLGAIQNRLDHTINNLSVTTENITAAESRIRDVDMAEEMMAYTKNNILVQASQAMLAQANQIPQGVLQLLQ